MKILEICFNWKYRSRLQLAGAGLLQIRGVPLHRDQEERGSVPGIHQGLRTDPRLLEPWGRGADQLRQVRGTSQPPVNRILISLLTIEHSIWPRISEWEAKTICWQRNFSTKPLSWVVSNCYYEVLSESPPRQCISPTCYNALYSADPLEKGEIDVRLNSFKGCFHQFLQSRKSN